MILDVTADMKNRVIVMPESDVYEYAGNLPGHITDSREIEYLKLPASLCKEFHAMATKDRFQALRASDKPLEERKYWAAASYNEKLKYLVAFHSLAVDGERCVDTNEEEQMVDYFENKFMTIAAEVYNDFAIDMCQQNGLRLMEIEEPYAEVEEVDDLEEIDTSAELPNGVIAA